MEVKVRIDCPGCGGSGRRTIKREQPGQRNARLSTCDKCAGTGKREEWRPLVSGLKIVDSEEAP